MPSDRDYDDTVRRDPIGLARGAMLDLTNREFRVATGQGYFVVVDPSVKPQNVAADGQSERPVPRIDL